MDDSVALFGAGTTRRCTGNSLHESNWANVLPSLLEQVLQQEHVPDGAGTGHLE